MLEARDAPWLEPLEPWLEPAWALASWLCAASRAAAPLLALLHAALAPLCYWQRRWEDMEEAEAEAPGPGPGGDPLWLSDEARALPLLGSFPSFLLGEASFQDALGALHRQYAARARAAGEAPGAVGLFEWRARPCVLLLDARLAARVLGADAASFAESAAPAAGRGLGACVPPALRDRLSPLLRAGSVEATARLMAECAEQLVHALAERAAAAAAGPVDVEVLGPLDRFSTAVVGACAFGVAGNCVQDPAWELHRVVRAARRPSPLSMLALAAVTALPSVAALVPARLLHPAAASFYVNMLRETAAFRARTRTRRADFVDLMSSTGAAPARELGFLTAKDRRRHCALAYDVVAAQALVLPATVRIPRVLARCLRELARRPGLQRRVAREVRAARAAGCPDQPLDLQVLQGSPLLERVLLEALRLEPACGALRTEVGAAGYTLAVRGPGPGRGLRLAPGTRLYVSVTALHADPSLYPEPLRFDPDRFSAEARRARAPGAYLPFGELPAGDPALPGWPASGLPPPAATTAALFALQGMALCLAALLADLEFGVSADRADRPDQAWLRVQRRPPDGDLVAS